MTKCPVCDKPLCYCGDPDVPHCSDSGCGWKMGKTAPLVISFKDFDNFVVHIPSTSEPKVTYELKRENGFSTCSCQGFWYHKHCNHWSKLLRDPIFEKVNIKKVREKARKWDKRRQKK